MVERQSVRALRQRPSSDVLIIGGGINGISTFRDLALQGVDVALVERGDYLSGASSASSHMIHGGVRYLENGELRLVSESVRERNRLLKNARHYVRPLRTTIPIYSTFSGILSAPLRLLTHRQGKPKERGALLIKVGLVIYDFFSRDGGTLPRHQFHGRKKSLSALPQLNPRLKYTATYFDASVQEPERLGLDVLRDGLDAGGATGTGRAANARAVNYVEAIAARDGAVVLRDRETGEELLFSARVIVNASGPWTDLTNAELGTGTALLGGTKGSHIVVDDKTLFDACGGRELFFENDDGRIVLIQPIKGRVMIGTTDLEADPAEPAICTEEEVDYFFGLVSHVFPAIVVGRPQIVYRFSGIRPLPRHDSLQPGFVSRDYTVVEGTLPAAPGSTLLSLVGGKWTTFRALGERLSDDALKILGKARAVSTADLAIGGGVGYPVDDDARAQWIASHRSKQSVGRAAQLLARYGTRATEVIAAVESAPDSPLENDATYSTGELRYMSQHEEVVHLVDVILRRTNHAFTGDVSAALLAEMAGILAKELGWNASRIAEELAAATSELEQMHGVRLAAAVVPAT